MPRRYVLPVLHRPRQQPNARQRHSPLQLREREPHAPHARAIGRTARESEIYINGVKEFEHTLASSGLTPEKIRNDPFAFDPTPFLKFGEENTIAVKVSSFGGVRGIWQSVHLLSSEEKLTVPQLVNTAIVMGKQ